MADPSDIRRPLPQPTPTTEPFWQGLRERRVRIQYSPSSGQWVFYPRSHAPLTLADDLEWREIAGTGTLYTYHDRATADIARFRGRGGRRS